MIKHLSHGLWTMPFRPFFLSAAIYGCISLIIWTSSLSGNLTIMVSTQWHIQEMIYGFSVAVVIGFLLTAAQTWTQIPTLKGWPLIGIYFLWFSARCLSITLPSTAAILDALFLFISSATLLRMVLISRNWRNFIFVPLLILLVIFRILFNFSHSFNTTQWTIAVWIIIQFIMIVAGRVIPLFTALGLNIHKIKSIPLVERSALIANLAFACLWWFDSTAERASVTGFLQIGALIITIIHFIRWLLWKPYLTVRVPLLWSLHLSYLIIIFGFAAIAMGVSNSSALHLITIGGIGSMILAMMARVSLGHTGRLLKVNSIISWAFSSILLAALVRASVIVWPHAYMTILWVSLTLWCLAFLIFLAQFVPILIKPRKDGKLN